MKINNHIVLDFNKTKQVDTQTIQCDMNSRFVRVSLRHNNSPIDLSDVRVCIMAVKPDGKEIFNDCTVIDAQNGIAEFEITKQMGIVVGEVECQIKLFGKEKLLSSNIFNLSVNKSLYPDSQDSKDQLNTLVDSLNRVDEWDDRFEQKYNGLEQEYAHDITEIKGLMAITPTVHDFIDETIIVENDIVDRVDGVEQEIVKTNTQLSQKLDQNSVLSMSNMGQDVKEAMTGGSVAVVGENSVLENNIVDGQVTMNKTSFFCDFYINLNNANECVGGSLNLSSGGISTTSSYTTSGFINVEYNESYKATKSIYTYCTYDKNKKFIKGYTLNNVTSFTIENDSNIKYIRCTLWGSDSITEWNFCREDRFVDVYIPFESTENRNVNIKDDSLKSEMVNVVKDNVNAVDIIKENSISPRMTNFLYIHHENLNNPDTCEQGYIGGNGNVINFNGVFVSGFIEVEEGMQYSGGGNWLSGYYDENKKFIENFNMTGINEGKSYWTVPIGKNIKYARVAGIDIDTMIVRGTELPTVYVPYTENDLRFESEEMKELFASYIGASGSPLKGLKANFLGDSITQGTGVSEGAYHYWIAKDKGLSVCRNYGLAGTRIAVTEEQDRDRAMCVRYKNMNDDADIIVLFGGTNDREAWLGTFDDRTETTFYGACHILIKGLLEKYPGKRIGVVTPIKYSPTSNENKIVSALKEVASYYNVPVCDLYNELGMCFALNSEIQSVYCPDGLHPNDEGHKIIARKVGAWLETL